MKDRNRNQPERIELVHKQTTPVPGPSVYAEAIANGSFVGTFDDFKDSLKGAKGDRGDDGVSPGSPQSMTDLFGI